MKDTKPRSLFIVIAIVLGIGWALQEFKGWSNRRLGAQIAARAIPGDIQMLSSVACPYCDRARAWFTEHRVAFSECVIERDEACALRFQAMMAPGTPVLLVRGKRLVGFNAGAVALALEQ